MPSVALLEGSSVVSLARPTSRFQCSHDGKRAVVSTRDQAIYLDLEKGTEIWSKQSTGRRAVSINRAGNVVAYGTTEGVKLVREFEGGKSSSFKKHLKDLPGRTASCPYIVHILDGNVIAYADNNQLRVCRSHDQHDLFIFNDAVQVIRSIELSPAEDIIFFTYLTSVYQVHLVGSATDLIYNGPSWKANDVLLLSTAQIACAADDEWVFVWDIYNPDAPQKFPACDASPTVSICEVEGTGMFAGVTESGKVMLWSLEVGDIVAMTKLTGTFVGIQSIGDNQLLVCDANGEIKRVRIVS